MYAVLKKDGQGTFLEVGNPKKAIQKASVLLGCRREDIHVINCMNINKTIYLFNHHDADPNYWLRLLALSGTPCYIGKPKA